jgi:hypothetical protein
MAKNPTVKIGALQRHVAKLARNASTENIDRGSMLTPNVGALVRDVGEDRALMALELRRAAIDPLLDMGNLAGFIRPGYGW